MDSVNTVTQWTQVKPVDAVCSGCSGIVIYGGGHIVFGAKIVKPVDAVDTICRGAVE